MMSLGTLESYMQIFIPTLIPFIVGLVFGFMYKKIRNILPKDRNSNVIRAIVSEYTRRLDRYENVIADLRVRMDLIESRGQKHAITQHLHSALRRPTETSSDISQDQSQPPSFYAYHNYEKVEPGREIPDDLSGYYDAQNGTTGYVLRLLNERPMTSREVQQAIGRSREHTSRLMKKLHEYGFVSRETNVKPFKYALVETGRMRPKEGRHVTQNASLDSTTMSHDSRIESTTN